ncbi:hypothetical protein [Micromonospora aurantiaca (nom. illeg.)]|uniref:hypothetical protein n=1 Tax=Micromonospora aurantiaca (nom. illeg.) TaxID=47850 RepID=UPI000F3D9F7D|nr:hypothetical protein [Micromonospora aurantiaca]RNH98122.1 hypothetical protein EEZ25_27915 [Micromonospora aurantiaca]
MTSGSAHAGEGDATPRGTTLADRSFGVRRGGHDLSGIPPRRRQVLDDLRAGRRDPKPGGSAPRRPKPADLVPPWRYPGCPRPQGARLDPAEWPSAVADAHC